jgi:subtilisin-like proprotein convertase family protein
MSRPAFNKQNLIMKILRTIVVGVTLGAILGGGAAEAALSVTDFSNGGSGTLYTGIGSGSQVIPDNTPAGAAYSINFATSGLNISDISITLNITGGYNGDLYAYLSHGSQIAYLLNPNPAVSGSGFTGVTLIEGTGSSIRTGGSGALTGSYTAYTDLATFNNTDPNGAWTLFFADLSSGDTSTLTGFSVGITAVPEPVNVALGIFLGLFAVGGGVSCLRRAGNKEIQPKA